MNPRNIAGNAEEEECAVVATLPGALSVNILWLGEIESLICSRSLVEAAHTFQQRKQMQEG